jgi:hypothetical protein
MMIRHAARWLVLAAVVLLPALAQAAAPAVITTARGSVKLVAGGQPAELPSTPFVLEAGQSLQVAAGAMVVILYQGSATKIMGPETVDLSKLGGDSAASSEGVGALNSLFTRQISTKRAGASRAQGDVQLLRPVPSSKLLAPTAIRWTCNDCEEIEVSLYDFQADEVLWTAKGKGSATYDGPVLHPGAYYLTIAGRDHLVTVPPLEERTEIDLAISVVEEAALSLDGAAPAEVVSLPASVFLQAGMVTEALYRIDAALEAHPDDPELQELRIEYETWAGLQP